MQQNDRLLGTRIGDYRIEKKLGQGGMAHVYKAYDERLQRDVALKAILPHYSHDKDFTILFQQEARLIAKLRHQNIVTVYTFGETASFPYLVMQYVSGGTLKERLHTHQPLDPRLATLYMLQMARALHHAHQHGIVHCDVKPANMLLASWQTNELLLADFGIAKIFAHTPGHGQTQIEEIVGTPPYMAPEQFTQQSIDARTDIYALGVVLYELLTGRVPFTADGLYGYLYHHTTVPPVPPRVLNPALPTILEEIAMRALAKSPSARFQSADEMARALKDVFSSPTTSSSSYITELNIPATTLQMPSNSRKQEFKLRRLVRPKYIVLLLLIIWLTLKLLINLHVVSLPGANFW